MNLLVVNGYLPPDSHLRSQLKIESVFEYHIKNKRYGTHLSNDLRSILPKNTELLLVNDDRPLTIGTLRSILSTEGLRPGNLKNIIYLSGTICFNPIEKAKILFEKLSLADKYYYLEGLAGKLFVIPVAELEQLDPAKSVSLLLGQQYEMASNETYYNLNNAVDLFECWRTATKERYFNKLEYSAGYISKSSSQTEKMQSEYRFLSNLSPSVRPFYPQVGSSTNSSYQIEYVPLLDMSKHLLHGTKGSKVVPRLLKKLTEYQACVPSKKVSTDDYRKSLNEILISKTQTRIESLKKEQIFLKLSPIFEMVYPGGLDGLWNKVQIELKKLIDRSHTDELQVIHGDLCLSNILFDSNTSMMKLVDPRGRPANSVGYLPALYDVAKLSHSFLGGYDLIVNDCVNVVINADLKIDVTHINVSTDFIKESKEEFRSWLKKQGHDVKTVRLIEADLFLGILPLHLDYPARLISFFQSAVDAFSEANG